MVRALHRVGGRASVAMEVMPRILPKRWFTFILAYCGVWLVLSLWTVFFALHTNLPDVVEFGGGLGFFTLVGAMIGLSEARPKVRRWLMGDWGV